MSKAAENSYLIEDWTDYDKSSLYDLSTKYYSERACDSFLNQADTIVLPNVVTSAYVHAHILAKFLAANLSRIPADKKLRVLEFGSGSGLFARHFLLAAAELNYLDRLEFLVSDISDLFLIQMKERGVFEGFTEGKHYQLVNLNLLDLDSAKTVAGEHIDLNDLDLVVSNYVLNALPMIPVRLAAEGSFEKLQIKITGPELPKEVDLVSNLNFFSSLKIEERWVDYDIESVSDIEKKYFELFKKHLNTLAPAMAGRFSYKALEAMDKIHSKLSEFGMFYLADIPSWGPNAFKFYSFYTNALANLISENLVIDFASSLGMEILKQKDQNLFRILFYKSENTFEPLKTSFNKDLVFSNKVNLFKKITDLLKNIDDVALLDVYKTLLDKLLVLDNKSVTSLVFQGDYYYLAGDSKTALDFYKKAQAIDFCNHHPDLDRKIKMIFI
jgi:SAM-dependent MidA family methyltransferase